MEAYNMRNFENNKAKILSVAFELNRVWMRMTLLITEIIITPTSQDSKYF